MEQAQVADGKGIAEREQKAKKERLRGESGAGWISQVLFLWFFPILQRARAGKLDFDDLPEVTAHDDPLRLYEKLCFEYEREVGRVQGKVDKKTGRPLEPSMFRVFLQTVGTAKLAVIFLLSILQTAASASVPLVARQVLIALNTPNVDEQRKWLLGAGITLLPACSALCQAAVTYISRRASMNLFTALTQRIFNKALVLSSASRQLSSSGQLVNLIATDAGTALERAILMLPPLFTSPIVLAVMLWLLYEEIGASMVSGFILMVIFMPINVFIFVKISKMYGATIKITDDRIKLVNESLQAIRVLKMYAWEIPFMEKITAMRNRELVTLRKHAYYYAVGLNAVFLQLPYLLQFTTLTTFYLAGNSFQAYIVFTAIMFFSVIQQSLTQLPSALSQLSQTLVAAHRIEKFVQLAELQVSDNESNFSERALGDVSFGASFVSSTTKKASASFRAFQVDRKGSILMEDASFCWDALAQSAEPGDSSDTKAGGAKPDHDKKSNKEKKKKKKSTKRGPTEKDAATVPDEVPGDVLKDICLRIRPGEKVAILGRVACGKSSLLLAISKEVRRSRGKASVAGSISYSAQSPFVLSCTVRENILFGKSFDQDRYDKVIKACSLEADLAVMTHGDATFIGERGLNLSGGQKARVSLARAVYADSDIVLLDDPLCAVDSHVGAAILNDLFFGELLKNKTLLVATNKVDRLDEFDRCILMEDGRILQQGKYGVDVHLDSKEFQALQERDAERPVSEELQVFDYTVESRMPSQQDDGENEETAVKQAQNADRKRDVLYSEEEEAVGTLKFSVLMFYVKSMVLVLFCIAYGGYLIYLFTPVISQYLLTFWTEEVACVTFGVQCNRAIRGENFWFYAYCAVLLGGLAICVSAGCLIAETRTNASRNIHAQLVKATFSASITDFFDIHPLGQVINRFAKDMSIIDFPLGQFFMFAFVTIAYTLAAFLGILLGTSAWLMLAIVPFLATYLVVYSYMRGATIQLQRLESKSRAPIYSNFSEVLNGLKTIRGFRQQQMFVDKNVGFITQNIAAYYLARVVLPTSLTLAINAMSLCLSFAVVGFILGTDVVTAGQAGLALTSMISIPQILNAVVMVCTEVEISMNSVERIEKFIKEVEPEDQLERTRLDGEPPAMIVAGQPAVSAEWPSRGEIVVDNLVVGYRQGPDVIKGISFTIQPAEKVGICGRTGSGKSSFLLALLRIVEPRSGSVLIDSVDISKLPLRQLRSHISIIPQTPVVFQDTLRFNLDPFQDYSDDEINQALRNVQLEQFVGKLDFELVEGGENVSDGQRQLIIFARALLRKSKLIFLDEASAMLDKETDKLLQSLIGTLFKDRTVLTIAHRLYSLEQNSTKVLVLDAGKIAEFDSPSNLLANPSSIFAGMVKAERAHSDEPSVERSDV